MSGAVWLFAANAATLAASLIVGVVLARRLGPSGFGIYSAVTVTTMFLTLLVTFRLELHLVTVLRNNAGDRGTYFAVLRASYCLVLPACIVGEAIALLALHGRIRTALSVDIGEIVLAPLLFRRVVLQVRTQMRQYATTQAFGRAVWVMTVLVVTVLRPAQFLVWIMASRVAAQGAEVLLLDHLAPLPRDGTDGGRHDPETTFGVLRRSIFLALSAIAGTGYDRLDQLLLTGIKGTLSTGIYSAAVRLGELPGMIGPALQGVTMPGLVELRRRGQQRQFDEAVIDSLVFMVVPAGLAIAVLITFPNQVINLVFGPKFSEAPPMLVLLAIAEWVTLPGAVYASIALAVDRRSAFLAGPFAGFVINLALNVFLIPRYGGVGAAWASLVGYSTAAIVHGLWGPEVRRSVRLTLIPLAKAGSALALSVGLGYTPGVPWGARLVLMAVAYLAMVGLLHADTWHRLLSSKLGPQRSV